jgi:hypothetical protein
MSKKRFSSGLDSLFDNPRDEHGFGETATAEKAPPPSVSELEAEVKAVVMKRTTTKNFTSDLDSLFNEAFTEVLEEKVDKLRRSSGLDDPFESKQNTYKKPLSGLDALIRSTVDTSLMGLEHAPIKRFTIMFENKKIEKLKNIAKQERAFVKDLVGDVLTEFINNYEKQHKM